MLPPPFYAEVPIDLGDDTLCWGRRTMQALQRLRRHQTPDDWKGLPDEPHPDRTPA
jgi:hypothetical protein